MTGAEHYDEAERYARLAGEAMHKGDPTPDRIQALMALTHVHIALAYAAPRFAPGRYPDEYELAQP